MGLTAEEQQELQGLQQKYGQTTQSAPKGGLSPEEQSEFDQLHQKYGQPQSQPSSQGSQQSQGLMDKLSALNQKMNAVTPEQLNEAAKHPITGMEDPAYQLMGLFSPGASGVVGKVGGVVRGFGDTLMQKAMGATKVVPGLGEDFAKAGMWGTKAGMATQAAKGMETSGQAIGDLASKIPGTIPQDTVANKVAEVAGAKMTPSGYVRPEEQALVDKALGKATDFAQAEPLTGAETAARRAQAGRAARASRGYAQTPSTTLKAEQAVAEQAGHSQALKEAYANAFPEAPNAFADADKQYSTFAKADDLLSKPESMGSATGFLSQFLPTTLAESVGGRAAIGTGKIIQNTPKGALPWTLQHLLTPKNQGQQ